MTTSEWAENEIRLAKAASGNDEYFSLCCDSAIKAFQSLMNDGHSGCSIAITMDILNHLVSNKPLTPITENDTFSKECGCPYDNAVDYQCDRMSSLFKTVQSDGTIKYTDINRITVYDVDSVNQNIGFHNGFVSNIIHDMFPIILPYTPEKIKVYVAECIADQKNCDGDFDTIGVFNVVKSDGTEIQINRYFKVDDASKSTEIDREEYDIRCDMDLRRRSEHAYRVSDEK